MLNQHVKVWPALPEHPRQDLRRSDYVIPKPPCRSLAERALVRGLGGGSTCRMPRGRPDRTHSAYSPAAMSTAAAMEITGFPRATLIASVKLTAAAPVRLIAREPNRLSCQENWHELPPIFRRLPNQV